MKHTPARIFMSLLAFGLAFTHMSCSSNLSELTGSVSLEIPQSIISNSARTGDDSSELYVVAMVKGDDYAAAQYKTIREGSVNSDDRFMKLIDIPAEKNIRIVMSVINSQGEIKYYGSTETFYVQHGINIQNIRLARINNDDVTICEQKNGDGTVRGVSAGNDVNSQFQIYFYNDGRYEILSSSNLIMSAGTWERASYSILQLTEFVYREFDPQVKFNEIDYFNYVDYYPNVTIAKEPTQYNFQIEQDDNYPDSDYDFTIKSGLKISNIFIGH